MAVMTGHGPPRKYPREDEPRMAELAQQLVDERAEWTGVVIAFANAGWPMSQSLLQRRFKEWGIMPRRAPSQEA
jgi:sugar phosphate isomerase/epimerase